MSDAEAYAGLYALEQAETALLRAALAPLAAHAPAYRHWRDDAVVMVSVDAEAPGAAALRLTVAHLRAAARALGLPEA